MKHDFAAKPRVFEAGGEEIRDYGKLQLDPWEMISLRTASGRDCDITATEWGYYLGSSLDGRMKREGFRTALVRNADGKHYVNVVEEDKIALFEDYLRRQKSEILRWLDENPSFE